MDLLSQLNSNKENQNQNQNLNQDDQNQVLNQDDQNQVLNINEQNQILNINKVKGNQKLNQNQNQNQDQSSQELQKLIEKAFCVKNQKDMKIFLHLPEDLNFSISKLLGNSSNSQNQQKTVSLEQFFEQVLNKIQKEKYLRQESKFKKKLEQIQILHSIFIQELDNKLSGVDQDNLFQGIDEESSNNEEEEEKDSDQLSPQQYLEECGQDQSQIIQQEQQQQGEQIYLEPSVPQQSPQLQLQQQEEQENQTQIPQIQMQMQIEQQDSTTTATEQMKLVERQSKQFEQIEQLLSREREKSLLIKVQGEEIQEKDEKLQEQHRINDQLKRQTELKDQIQIILRQQLAEERSINRQQNKTTTANSFSQMNNQNQNNKNKRPPVIRQSINQQINCNTNNNIYKFNTNPSSKKQK